MQSEPDVIGLWQVIAVAGLFARSCVIACLQSHLLDMTVSRKGPASRGVYGLRLMPLSKSSYPSGGLAPDATAAQIDPIAGPSRSRLHQRDANMT